MTRNEKITLIKVLGLTGLILGGVVAGSHFWPMIKSQPSEIVHRAQETIGETDLGKQAFKILGVEVEEETDKEEDEDKEEEEDKKEEDEKNKSLMENIKDKIEEAVIESSSEKVIDILETLPPEEFEKLQEEFCPRFCEEKSNE